LGEFNQKFYSLDLDVCHFLTVVLSSNIYCGMVTVDGMNLVTNYMIIALLARKLFIEGGITYTRGYSHMNIAVL